MCPLSNLIHLLDSYEHFTKVTNTKFKEYVSCRLRFNEYMEKVGNVRNGHLLTCKNSGESKNCCKEYLYNTVPVLIDEVLETIAVPYIINFTYGDNEFLDNCCTECQWDRENFKMIHNANEMTKLPCTDFFLTKTYRRSEVYQLLRSFEYFVKITNTKAEEYKSCRRRFDDYCILMEDVEDNHLDICEFFGEKEINSCECKEYIEDTLPELVSEIVHEIGLSYIINFDRPRTTSQIMFSKNILELF